MSAGDGVRVKRIAKRWADERKISATDVEFLLTRAKKADTFEAARDLNNASRHSNPHDLFDIFGLGGRP